MCDKSVTSFEDDPLPKRDFTLNVFQISNGVWCPVASVSLDRNPSRYSDAVRDGGVGHHDVGLTDVLRWQRLPVCGLQWGFSKTV